jgi:glucose-6-phosphate 1-dehydrogenase
VTEKMKKGGLLQGKGWKRVVYEKPFGYDLKSARKLNRCVTSVFQEKEIYRIDHYLGKELVQNILVLRFANSLFEQIWNKKFIDHIQITIAEKVGVGERGRYYDHVGAVRDMVQNHLLQVLSLVAMEPPVSIQADAIRDKKVKVLRVLRKSKPSDIVIGQYGRGKVDGKTVKAYREEAFVNANSDTETFAALKVCLDNKRWKGVPFYIRTGKRLKERLAEVNLVLKDVACKLFCSNETFFGPNIVSLRIQPQEGFAVRFNVKKPGPVLYPFPVSMEFSHKAEFGMNTPEAYKILLHEIMLGSQTLFTRWDGVEESWKFADRLLKIVKNKTKNFPNYRAGTFGPKEAEDLLHRDGRNWIVFERKVKV